MRTDVQTFGLGMTFCNDRTNDTGSVEGRYDYLTTGKNWDAWNAQLQRQRLPPRNTRLMDLSGLVPFPSSNKDNKDMDKPSIAFELHLQYKEDSSSRKN